jgi:DNA-binding response OmpR family regulator
MDFAVCAAFLEADIWESRLRDAAVPRTVEITECNSAGTLLSALALKPFSLVTVILDGGAGLEAVRQIRAKAPDVPLIWISNEDFSMYGYQYHVTYFLRKPLSEAQLREAVRGCLRLEEGRMEK